MASNLVIRLVEERFEEVDIDMDDHGHADARDFDGEVTVVAVADEHAFAAGEGAGGDAYPFAPFQLFDVAHLDFDFGGEEIFEHLEILFAAKSQVEPGHIRADIEDNSHHFDSLENALCNCSVFGTCFLRDMLYHWVPCISFRLLLNRLTFALSSLDYDEDNYLGGDWENDYAYSL